MKTKILGVGLGISCLFLVGCGGGGVDGSQYNAGPTNPVSPTVDVVTPQPPSPAEPEPTPTENNNNSPFQLFDDCTKHNNC